MNWKIKVSSLLILLCGCQSQKIKEEPQNIEEKPLFDLPKHFLVPTSPPKYNIQINSIPHPFNLNGSHPYAVWVNGERLPLSGSQVRVLAQSLNLKFQQPKDTAEIHNGNGWQHPLKLNSEPNPKQNQNLFEEEVFIDVE